MSKVNYEKAYNRLLEVDRLLGNALTAVGITLNVTVVSGMVTEIEACPPKKEIESLRLENDSLRRDLEDVRGSVFQQFVRCGHCGRLYNEVCVCYHCGKEQ